MNRIQGEYDLAGKIIGIAMKIHSTLGPGFLESVYENALRLELEEAGIPFEVQKRLPVFYRGKLVGDFVCDILVSGALIVELKSLQSLAAVHEVQIVNYLSATGLEEGLLLNFGAQSLEYKKKFQTFRSNANNFVNSVNFVKIRAFTMIELLVAMTVLTLLVVMLMGLVDSTTKLWRQNENRVDSYREARAALGIISRDLDNIVSTDDTNYFAIDRIMVNGAVSDTNLASTLFFLTALPKSAQWSEIESQNKTDVCTVGYFLADAVLPGAVGSKRAQRTRNLYRYFLASDQTYANLIQTNMFQGVSPSSTLEAELLARNVTEFKVEAFTNTGGTWGAFSQTIDSPIPKLVQITIKAVNNETAQKLDGADWSNTNSPLIKQVVQTFQTHVTIPDPR